MSKERHENASQLIEKYISIGSPEDLENFKKIIIEDPNIIHYIPDEIGVVLRPLPVKAALFRHSDPTIRVQRAVECLIAMIQAGGDLSAKDWFLENSFLHWMIANDSNELTLHFLKEYIKQQKVPKPININEVDIYNRTPLFLAVCKKYYKGKHEKLMGTDNQIIETLVGYGASLDICDKKNENNIFHIAFLKRDIAVLDILLSSTQFNKDLLYQENKQKETPFDMLEKTHEEAVNILFGYYGGGKDDIILEKSEWEENKDVVLELVNSRTTSTEEKKSRKDLPPSPRLSPISSISLISLDEKIKESVNEIINQNDLGEIVSDKKPSQYEPDPEKEIIKKEVIDGLKNQHKKLLPTKSYCGIGIAGKLIDLPCHDNTTKKVIEITKIFDLQDQRIKDNENKNIDQKSLEGKFITGIQVDNQTRLDIDSLSSAENQEAALLEIVQKFRTEGSKIKFFTVNLEGIEESFQYDGKDRAVFNTSKQTKYSFQEHGINDLDFNTKTVQGKLDSKTHSH